MKEALLLSRKKTRIGSIKTGFHFLGIHYPGTQTSDITDKACSEKEHILPHARTLRKAREQIKCMVTDGISAHCIRNYLHRWALWWCRTSEIWQYDELLKWFIESCWENNPATEAAMWLLFYHSKSNNRNARGLENLISDKPQLDSFHFLYRKIREIHCLSMQSMRDPNHPTNSPLNISIQSFQ